MFLLASISELAELTRVVAEEVDLGRGSGLVVRTGLTVWGGGVRTELAPAELCPLAFPAGICAALAVLLLLLRLPEFSLCLIAIILA